MLVTDPSAAQLQVARQRAESLGLTWVRFLVAPVEDLPIASNSVDLVLGSTFLHFTDTAAAIRSMARVTKPGGRVAVSAGLRLEYGGAWRRALEPVRRVLLQHGLPYRDPFLPEEDLTSLFANAGLTIERSHMLPVERLLFPHTDIAIAVPTQARWIPLLLREAPENLHESMQMESTAELRRAIDDMGLEAASLGVPMIHLLARKPS